ARLSGDLLLLPEGLLPVVLLVATGLPDPGRARALLRRDSAPIRAPERAPLLLLAVAGRGRLPLVGRPDGVPVPRRLRGRARDDRAGRQRHLPDALHALVPLLPPPLRRPPRHVQGGADPLPALARRQPPERAARPVRLDQPLRRRAGRPVRAADRDGC